MTRTLLAMLPFPLGVLAAQASAPPATLRYVIAGTVWDSLRNRPLADAVVQLVPLETSVRGASRATRADSLGRFRFDSLPQSRFAIGFQYPALEILGVDIPPRALTLTTDSLVEMTLATPSPEQALRLVCPSSTARPARAAIAGTILDGRRETGLKGVRVQLQSLSRGATGVTEPLGGATTSEGGSFRICDMPADSVRLAMSAEGYRTVEGPVGLAPGALRLADFRLAEVNVSRGDATLAGHVEGENAAAAYDRGEIAIPALGLRSTVVRGNVLMSALPPGTWLVTFRGIGLSPVDTLVDLLPATRTELTLIFSPLAQTLSSRDVTANANIRDRMVIEALEQHRVAGGGTVFMPGDRRLADASRPSDIVRQARGFSVKRDDWVEARPYVQSYRTLKCFNTTQADTGRGNRKEIAMYVDGQRYKDDLSGLDRILLPGQVFAAELYPDVLSAPFIWRTPDACAVIAFWTKR